MRLLHFDDNGELRLTENLVSNIPPYAIRGSVDEEISFRNIMEGTVSDLRGYKKISFCGQQAKRDGLQYFWIDTCCFNAIDSTELQYTMNSMFLWYCNAAKCYVYLEDVSMSRLLALFGQTVCSCMATRFPKNSMVYSFLDTPRAYCVAFSGVLLLIG